jgi:hypothetical protein
MKIRPILQETKILSQKEMREFYEDLPQDEEDYVKKELELDYRIAEKPEKVITSIDGEQETVNKANEGDYIITGVKGENYVLDPKKFNERYFIDGNYAKTKPVEITAKQYKGKNMSFMAKWGEEMKLNYNDFLVRNGNEIYRIERRAFTETYEPKD